jgi:hypothetical protein
MRDNDRWRWGDEDPECPEGTSIRVVVETESENNNQEDVVKYASRDPSLVNVAPRPYTGFYACVWHVDGLEHREITDVYHWRYYPTPPDGDEDWMEFCHPKMHLCGLCAGYGLIDTRGIATPAGIECGGVHHCICPNGRDLKAVGLPLHGVTDETVEAIRIRLLGIKMSQ